MEILSGRVISSVPFAFSSLEIVLTLVIAHVSESQIHAWAYSLPLQACLPSKPFYGLITSTCCFIHHFYVSGLCAQCSSSLQYCFMAPVLLERLPIFRYICVLEPITMFR